MQVSKCILIYKNRCKSNIPYSMYQYIYTSHINIYLAYTHRSTYAFIRCIYPQDPHGQDIDIMYISLYVACISISMHVMSMHDLNRYILNIRCKYQNVS